MEKTQVTELEYIFALAALSGSGWSWAYVSFFDGIEEIAPSKAYIAIHQDTDGAPGEEIIHRVEIENPTGGVYNLLRHLMIKDGRRIIKAKHSAKLVSEYRAYRNGVRIPDHIISRGSDITHLTEDRKWQQ